MKALSLTQPHASLFLTPAKRWETRSRRIHYRGWLAIHAAKGFPGKARRLCHRKIFAEALRAECGIVEDEQLGLGCIVGFVFITGCTEAERVGSPTAAIMPQGPHETAFGDFRRGRYAWQRDVETIRLQTPVPCSGMLGLWDVPERVEKTILRQMGLGAMPTCRF